MGFLLLLKSYCVWMLLASLCLILMKSFVMVAGKEGSTFERLTLSILSLLEAQIYFAKSFTKKFFLGKKELNFSRVFLFIHNEEYNGDKIVFYTFFLVLNYINKLLFLIHRINIFDYCDWLRISWILPAFLKNFGVFNLNMYLIAWYVEK